MLKPYEFDPRHITVGGKPTMVSIEKLYWSAIDHLATSSGYSSDKYLKIILANQPSDYKSRAGWIRFWVTGRYFLAFKRGQKAAAKQS
jgi:hypothetical protein